MFARSVLLAATFACVLAVAAAIDAGSLIQTNEGSRSCVYTDTRGHPTVGIGFNLDRSDAPSRLSSCGLDYNKVRSGAECLSSSQINCLFQPDLQNAVSCAASHVNGYYSLCQNAQAVAADLAFNLGCAGFASFSTFNSLLGQKQYSSAASDLQGTLWCSQVGQRCPRDTGYLRQC